MERCRASRAVPRESDQRNRVEPRSGLRRQTQAVDRGAQRMHVETLVAIGATALVVIGVTTVMVWIVR
jgi:hypothetical protein